MDNAERERLTQEATRCELHDETALSPRFVHVNAWAMRRSVTYEARTDQMTLTFSARRVD